MQCELNGIVMFSVVASIGLQSLGMQPITILATASC